MTYENTSSLGRISIFSGIGNDCLELLESQATVKNFPRNSVIFEQGKIPEHLPILLEGSIQLVGSAHDQRQVVVDIVRAVDVLCVDAVLVAMPSLTTARVVTPALVMLIPTPALVGGLRMDPVMASRLLAVVVRQCRNLVRQVKDLKLRTTNQRLAAYLLERLAEGDGTVVHLPYDKRLIASRLGMTPESFSRALSTLRRFGVETNAHTVRIPDPDRLRAYALPDDPEIGGYLSALDAVFAPAGRHPHA